jgi:surface antigen
MGQAVGSNIANYEGRMLAEVAGVLLGQVFDNKLGSSMDKADYFCTGQTLELAKDGQRVEGQNPYSSARYWVEPSNRYQQGNHLCRNFVSTVDQSGRRKTKTACRQSNGSWLLY